MAALNLQEFVLSLLVILLVIIYSFSPASADPDAAHPTYFNYFCHDTPVYCCFDIPQLTGNWSLLRYSVPLECGKVGMWSSGFMHDKTFAIRRKTIAENSTMEENLVQANVTSAQFSAGRWISSGKLFSTLGVQELQSFMLLGFASYEEIGENLTYESLLFSSCGVYLPPGGGPPSNVITEVGILVKEGLEQKYQNLTLLESKYNRALTYAKLPLVSGMNTVHNYDC